MSDINILFLRRLTVSAAAMAPIKLIDGVPTNRLKKRIKEVFAVTPKPKAINGAIITTGKLDNTQ